jgi:TonB family protein
MRSGIILFFIAISSFCFAQDESFNVQSLPQNVGGKAELKRVFQEQLQYPEKLLADKVGGKVTFNFVVNRDSSITELKMSSSGVPELDAEAQRIFKFFKWVPAIQGGVYMSARWSETFEFNPAKYSKICKERGFVKTPVIKDEAIDSTNKIYKVPEQFPMYQKGNFALQDFIKENLEYPRQAEVANIQGCVVLRFVVEPSGLVTNISVDKPIGGGCEIEATRVLQLIRWYPGKVNGKLARVEMTYPFYFVLDGDYKDNSSGEQK